MSMSMSVNVPEELYRRAAEVATAENISIADLANWRSVCSLRSSAVDLWSSRWA